MKNQECADSDMFSDRFSGIVTGHGIALAGSAAYRLHRSKSARLPQVPRAPEPHSPTRDRPYAELFRAHSALPLRYFRVPVGGECAATQGCSEYHRKVAAENSRQSPESRRSYSEARLFRLGNLVADHSAHGGTDAGTGEPATQYITRNAANDGSGCSALLLAGHAGASAQAQQGHQCQTRQNRRKAFRLVHNYLHIKVG